MQIGDYRKYRLVVGLREHITSLAKENDLKVIYSKTKHMSRPFQGKVWIPYIKTEIDYWTALHEIGHCMADGSFSEKECELLAWEWAFANSSIVATREVKFFVELCLASYDVVVSI